MDKEIKITKSELRKKSSEFRMYANRLMHTQVDEGMKNLRRFIDFINKDLIINDFINKNHIKEFDIQSICAIGNSGMGYHIPDDSPELEITFTYQLLQYGLQTFYNDGDGYWHLAATKENYMGGMDKVVSKFSYSVVKPFIYHIEKYLSDLQIDLGDDENSKVIIHFKGDNYGHNIGANMTEMNINQSNSSIGVGVNQGEINTEKLAGTINEADKRNIAEVAAEIQQLLEQLEKSYSTNNTADKMTIATEFIKHIDSNPTLAARIISALKVGSVKAFEQLLSHPAASFVIGALEDWQKTKES